MMNEWRKEVVCQLRVTCAGMNMAVVLVRKWWMLACFPLELEYYYYVECE